MLFHSQVFVFLFLPLTIAGYYLASWRDQDTGGRLRLLFLIAASFVFYGYWDPRLVPLLAGSAVVNWCFAAGFGRFGRAAAPRLLMPVGIALNLFVLGIFKYANFFSETFATVTGEGYREFSIALPLGISFFTFQQISYLADLSRKEAPLYRFGDYVLYVTFFPQLIAGPIVRHSEIIDQYRLSPLRDGVYERLSRGFTIFVIGLAAKVLFADKLALWLADPIFARVADGQAVGAGDAWAGMIAFGLQIFFDFGGYSIMAIGLGLMMGFVLPRNFNVPYIAVSIQDFWRRWHMTLSRFLRDYLYFPLGGSRHGAIRTVFALMATMLLGGLWHGAGWSFVAWGGIHGAALVVNHAWNRGGFRMPAAIGWGLTMTVVFFAWVLFRAENFGVAWSYYGALFSGTEAAVFQPHHVWFLAAAAILSVAGWLHHKLALEWLPPRAWTRVPVSLVLVMVMLEAGSSGHVPFIYFQF